MTVGTLAAELESACRRWPERPALGFRGETTTYAALGSAVAALAAGYRRIGVEGGDRIVCALPNSPAHLIAANAAWAAGAVHVAADHELTGPELADYVELTSATALLFAPTRESEDPYAPLRTVAERHPGTHLVSVGGERSGTATHHLSDLIQGEDAAPPDTTTPADAAAIFATSGSTGRPKLPLHFHGKLHASWTGLARGLGFGVDDVHLVQLPLSHGFGLMLATAGLVSGGRLVIVDDFQANEALRTIERERVTVLNGTPAHFTLLAGAARDEGRRPASLRVGVGAGAAFPLPLVRAIFDELGFGDFMLMYGSSEGVGVATMDREEMLLGSVGRPEPGTVAVVGADRRPVPTGTSGEIAFSRSESPVRYWGDADAGAATGWYYTGDLGRLDEEGRLYVLGRLKHQISRGGLEIDPAEVETALLECACVADAAAIGTPNPVLGEVVCACVVPADGREPVLEELRSQLRGRLARFKLPEELCLLDALPRTALGKVDRIRLRAEVLARQRESLRTGS